MAKRTSTRLPSKLLNNKAVATAKKDPTEFGQAALETQLSTNSEPAITAPDPFNPSSLRVSPDFQSTIGVKEVLASIPVDKPSSEWFCRVHPSDEYALHTYVIELRTDKVLYLVDRTLWPALAGEPTFSPRAIYLATNRQGLYFLWPCRLPGSDGKSPDWITLPLEAVRQARAAWTRLFWDAGQGRHRIQQALVDLGEPKWPTLTLAQVLKLGFKDRFIATLEVLKHKSCRP
jgi:hypothetical protein